MQQGSPYIVWPKCAQNNHFINLITVSLPHLKSNWLRVTSNEEGPSPNWSMPIRTLRTCQPHYLLVFPIPFYLPLPCQLEKACCQLTWPTTSWGGNRQVITVPLVVFWPPFFSGQQNPLLHACIASSLSLSLHFSSLLFFFLISQSPLLQPNLDSKTKRSPPQAINPELQPIKLCSMLCKLELAQLLELATKTVVKHLDVELIQRWSKDWSSGVEKACCQLTCKRFHLSPRLRHSGKWKQWDCRGFQVNGLITFDSLSEWIGEGMRLLKASLNGSKYMASIFWLLSTAE